MGRVWATRIDRIPCASPGTTTSGGDFVACFATSRPEPLESTPSPDDNWPNLEALLPSMIPLQPDSVANEVWLDAEAAACWHWQWVNWCMNSGAAANATWS